MHALAEWSRVATGSLRKLEASIIRVGISTDPEMPWNQPPFRKPWTAGIFVIGAEDEVLLAQRLCESIAEGHLTRTSSVVSFAANESGRSGYDN